MKKWECTVCGYIHEGDEPPKECPVCGAGAEYFKEVVDEKEGPAPETQPEAQPETVTELSGESAETTVKKWECTVCGYIHEGKKGPRH